MTQRVLAIKKSHLPMIESHEVDEERVLITLKEQFFDHDGESQKEFLFCDFNSRHKVLREVQNWLNDVQRLQAVHTIH